MKGDAKIRFASAFHETSCGELSSGSSAMPVEMGGDSKLGVQSLRACFANLILLSGVCCEPRQTHHDSPYRSKIRRHQLWHIIAITICVVIRNADDWTDVEEYGRRGAVMLGERPRSETRAIEFGGDNRPSASNPDQNDERSHPP